MEFIRKGFSSLEEQNFVCNLGVLTTEFCSLSFSPNRTCPSSNTTTPNSLSLSGAVPYIFIYRNRAWNAQKANVGFYMVELGAEPFPIKWCAS